MECHFRPKLNKNLIGKNNTLIRALAITVISHLFVFILKNVIVIVVLFLKLEHQLAINRNDEKLNLYDKNVKNYIIQLGFMNHTICKDCA